MTISKSKLKAQMLQIFRQIEQTGEEAIVTDNQRPVLRITPLKRNVTVHEAFGAFQGRIRYNEPITTPTTIEWTAV
ncbi:MAG: prevent-host-death protein [candidate division Zixibacteria bacterium]|nr:prevent-host-death protein [candidate division Zixibacteria bacterium]